MSDQLCQKSPPNVVFKSLLLFSQVGCQYWTFYENEGACFSFVSCSNLDPTECDGCISGDVDCQEKQCDLQGQCDGSLVKFDVVATRYEYYAQVCLSLQKRDFKLFFFLGAGTSV